MVNIITLTGSPYERGLKQGRSFKELIRAYHALRRSMFNPDNPSEGAVSEIIEEVRGGLEAKCPEVLEEMRGIAEGAGLRFAEILFINFASEVDKGVSGCTTILSLGDPTSAKNMLLGKTRDLGSPLLYPFQTSVKIRRKDGDDIFVASSMAGILGAGFGVNRRGLALALNAADRIQDLGGKVGVQRSILARKALEECGGVNEAVAFLSHHNLAYCGALYILADSTGHGAIVEKSRVHQAVRSFERGTAVAANHFVEPSMRGYLAPLDGTSPLRLKRAGELSNPHQEGLTIPQTKRILKDHLHGLSISSICRHTPTGPNTVAGYILEVGARRTHICDGHPCENPFKKFEFT